jgi:hypothetical protein
VGRRHRELDGKVDGEVGGEHDVDGEQDQGQVEDRSQDAIVREDDMEEPSVGGYRVRCDDPGD